MNKTYASFRRIAYAEGVSFLLLLGIAMPLKYLYGQPLAVKYFGWAHGVLFILYVFTAAQVAQDHSWPFRRLFLAWVAAVLPLGPFVFDRRFLHSH